MQRFLFPRWINPFLMLLGAFIAGGGVYALAMGGLVTDPDTLNIGYQPEQPVPFELSRLAAEDLLAGGPGGP